MLSTILIIVLIVIALAVMIAMQPSDFRISRSMTIDAPAAAAFDQINDFHKWEHWSPWEKVDPQTKKSYSGEPSGIGAKYAWEGDKNVGKGEMEILESRPHELIRIKLHFLKPMETTSTTDFTFRQDGGKTVVTQSMYGPNSFIAKAMHLVMSMDKMIGTQFEKGLADLKSIAESTAK